MTLDPQHPTGQGSPPPSPPPPYPGSPAAAHAQQPLTYQHAFIGRRAPTGVTVLSILSIVLGSFWLLVGAYGLLLGVGAIFMSQTAAGTAAGVDGMVGYLAWEAGTAVVRGLIGVFLLVVSIACLRMAPWGRAGMVRYAQVDLAWVALKFVLAIAWAIPAQRAMINNMMRTMPPPPTTTTAPATAPAGGAATTTTTTSMTSTPFSSAATVTVSSVGTSTPAATATVVPAAALSVGPTWAFENVAYVSAALLAMVSVIYPIIVWRYMTRRHVREAFHGVTPPPPHS